MALKKFKNQTFEVDHGRVVVTDERTGDMTSCSTGAARDRAKSVYDGAKRLRKSDPHEAAKERQAAADVVALADEADRGATVRRQGNSRARITMPYIEWLHGPKDD